MTTPQIDTAERRLLFTVSPLGVDTTGRRLVDESGEAIFFQGDTAWSLLTGATSAEADAYLTDRAARGVNLIVINLVEALFNGPENQNGDAPFSVEGDFSTPNEDYFAHADLVLRRAEALGIYVLLAPAYLGFPDTDSGWYDAVLASGVEKMRGYGAFVGNRYKDFSNIVWMQGGDRNPGDAVDEVNALVAGIKSSGDTHLHTAHAQPDFSPADVYDQPWLDFSNIYSYEPTYLRGSVEYSGAPTRPMLLVEDRYENMGSTPLLRRANKYWAILSGGFGAIMGNDPIWRAGTDWTTQFDSPLARDMSRLGTFFRGLDWDQLQPASELFVDGQGLRGNDDYAVAALSDDRELILAYVPSARPISLNLSQMAGPITAQWWDPTSGTFVSAGSVAAASNVSFTPPSANASGAADWMLVLDGADAAPAVRWINFEVDRRAPAVTMRFSEFVGASLDAADLQVVRRDTGIAVPAGLFELEYDYNTQTAAFFLPKTLADGDYDVRLVGGGVRDRSGSPLASDVTYTFRYLAGDATRDGVVDFADLLRVVQNFNTSGRVFTEGNFDYDPQGRVDFDDLLVLVQRYDLARSAISRPQGRAARSLRLEL